MIGWTSMAWAAPPELAVGVIGAAADGTQEIPSWAGAQAAVELPIRPWAVGARIRGGWTADGELLLAAEPTIRAWLSDPDHTALSAVLGAGGQLEGAGVAPVASAGLGVDLGPRRTVRPRVESTYHYAPTTDVWRLSLAVSAVFGRRPPEPEPEPIVEVPPPAPVATSGMVWYPAPVCQWLEADEALLAALSTQPEAWFDENGLQSDPGGQEVPDRANLVVAAWPGDRVEVDGSLLSTDAHGLGVIVRQPGPGTVRVVGGGRVETLDLAVGNHQGLWFAVPPPREVQVRFALASSRLEDSARQQLAEMASLAGGWAFEVRGGYSPEGDPERNRALAVARAEAVASALRGLGVSDVRVAERIDVLTADVEPEALRVAIVTAVAPAVGEAP